jgi:predicted  nucleic acid-binding Zn-ribbon protein
MSTINALAHHIDQLLTQHRALQQDYVHLQSRVKELEQQLLEQQQAANTLLQEKKLAPEQDHDQTMEDELNHLIGLFDQVTEAHHD